MTIETTARVAGPLSGNGSTTVFAFVFKVFDETQLNVITLTSGVYTTKTLTTHYTVSLNADQDDDPGGSVTFLTAPASGTSVFIESAVPYTQTTEVSNAGGFYPEVINAALDKLTALVQQNSEKLDRAAVAPLGETFESDDLQSVLEASDDIAAVAALADDGTLTAVVAAPALTAADVVDAEAAKDDAEAAQAAAEDARDEVQDAVALTQNVKWFGSTVLDDGSRAEFGALDANNRLKWYFDYDTGQLFQGNGTTTEAVLFQSEIAEQISDEIAERIEIITKPRVTDDGTRWAMTFDLVDPEDDTIRRVVGGLAIVSDSLIEFRLASQDGLVAVSGSSSGTATDYTYDGTTYLCYPTDEDVGEIWAIYGQSNAQAVNPDYATDTAYYASAPQVTAWMPSTGVRVTLGQSYASWVNLAETVTTNLGETCASSFADHYIDRIYAATGKTPTLYMINGAETAKATRELNRGSEWYQRTMEGVAAAALKCREDGLRPYCPGVLYVQGEREEYFENYEGEWATAIKRLARTIEEDVRRITGQTERVLFFMVAVDGGAGASPNSGTYDPASNAEAYIDLHGWDNIRVVGPHYFCEISSDLLHLTNKGQAAQGAMFAYAASEELWGDGWNCIRPRERDPVMWRSATEFDIICNLPPKYGDLANSGASVVTSSFTNSVDGFIAYLPKSNTLATISSISIVAEPGSAPGLDRRVRVTLASDPGERVWIYAGMRNDSAGNGPVVGGRTLVHSSTGISCNFASYTLYHWLVPFALDCGYYS